MALSIRLTTSGFHKMFWTGWVVRGHLRAKTNIHLELKSTTCTNIYISDFFQHTIFMHFVKFSEQTGIILLKISIDFFLWMTKHLLSFKLITEFLGHVPSFKGSNHCFHKNHFVANVFHFEVRNSWLIFTKSAVIFTTLEGFHRRTDSKNNPMTRKIVGEKGH
jgi:hypothetical protein